MVFVLVLVSGCSSTFAPTPPAPPVASVPPTTPLPPPSPPAQPPAHAAAFPDRTVEGYLLIGNCMMTLEVAETPDERRTGLMERTSLPPGHGMVFVYSSESKWAFWMKNTLIPLDAVWVSQAGQVVDVQTMVPQPGVPDNQFTIYNPRAVAMYAIELAEGVAHKAGLAAGSQVQLQLTAAPAQTLPLCGR